MSVVAPPSGGLGETSVTAGGGRGRNRVRRALTPLATKRRLVLGLKLSALQIICGLIAVVIFTLPLVYIFIQSLKRYQGFLAHPTGLPHPATFGNYGAAWAQGGFGREMINSLVYAIVPDIVTLILGVFLAFPISRNYFRHSNFLYAFFLFSGFLPGALIPLFIEARFLHLYNSMPGYLLIISLGGAGFFFFVGYIKGIPRELDEAAAMDGCGYVRFIFQIIIPLMKPALATFAIFGFVAEWNSLIMPIVLLNSQKLWPITRGLYGFFGSHAQNWPIIAAATMIVAGPILVVFALLQRYLVEGVSGGAATGSSAVTQPAGGPA